MRMTLEMSVVRGVGEVCMCLVGGVGGWRGLGGCVTRLGLGFNNSGGTWGKWDMCLCFGCDGVGGVRGEWVDSLGQGLGGWGGVMSAWIMSLDSLYYWHCILC